MCFIALQHFIAHDTDVVAISWENADGSVDYVSDTFIAIY